MNYQILLRTFKSDVLGALSVTAFSLPTGIGIGMVALGSLGMEYAVTAVLAGLYAMLFSSLIYFFLGHSPHHFNGPGSASAGILGSMMATIISNPHIQAQVGNHSTVINLAISSVFFCIFLAGLIQLLVAQLRLGEIIKLIPYSVIAGIINGIVVLIILQQLPRFFGLAADQQIFDLITGRVDIHFYDTLVSLSTIACILLGKRYFPILPQQLLGIVGGTLIYHGLTLVLGDSALGTTIGNIPNTFPLPTQAIELVKLINHPLFYSLLPLFFTTAVAVALITGIECLIVATTVDNLTNSRHDSISELTALGGTNMVAALFGGLSSGGSLGRVTANYNAGGKTKLANLISALFLFIFIVFLGPVVGTIPFTAIAATLLMMAISLVDNWTKFLVQRVFTSKSRPINYSCSAIDLSLVSLVTLLMIFTSLTVAIIVGLIVELILFLFNARQALVRRSYHGNEICSNTVRNTQAMAALRENGHLIIVLELQGNLFFGTADYLANLTDKIANSVEIIIFDFRRVVDIDKSGANILKQIDNRLSSKNKILLLSYLPKDSDKRLQLIDIGFNQVIDEGRVFDDTGTALSFAEEKILSLYHPSLLYQHEIELGSTIPLANFTESELAIIRNYLKRQTFSENTRIIAEHDEANGMYILTLGRISVLKKVNEHKFVKLVNFGPGVSFGEMALLAKERRSADVYATSNIACYFLSMEDFKHLHIEYPGLALKFISNIAASLSRRLSAASSVIRDLDH
jgi:MFS superfamily sulfate permease-like transporter